MELSVMIEIFCVLVVLVITGLYVLFLCVNYVSKHDLILGSRLL